MTGRVEFRRVVRGRVWHVGLAHQQTSALCSERTGDRGVEVCLDAPPIGARVCPRCLAVCRLLGSLDAPNVWDPSVPPGGEVCSVCGVPTESEPCSEHQPHAYAEMLDNQP